MKFATPLVLATLAVGPAWAEHHESHDDHRDHDTMMEEMDHMDAVSGTGVVNAIDMAGRTVNLSHDPIPVLGMPAMTMDMAVGEDAHLHGLSPGTAVDFTLVKGPDGIYQIGTVTARE